MSTRSTTIRLVAAIAVSALTLLVAVPATSLPQFERLAAAQVEDLDEQSAPPTGAKPRPPAGPPDDPPHDQPGPPHDPPGPPHDQPGQEPGRPDPTPGGGHPGGPGDEAASPSGRLREVDVAHVDDLVNGGAPGVIVTVAGTGAGHAVATWHGDAANPPTHLQTTAPRPGRDVRVHAPQPTLDPRIVVTAARRDDGNLWLTSWSVTPDGVLSELDTRGYGANAGVRVEEYALTSQPARRRGVLQHYELVTPVRVVAPRRTSRSAMARPSDHDSGRIRVVTWSVDPVTGAIGGLADSADFGTPGSPSHLSIAPLTGASYEVSHRDADGVLGNHSVLVSGGVPALRGSGSSGLDLHGQATVTEALTDGAVGPLNDAGFVTALRSGDDLRLVTWENRVTACDGPCYVTPFRVTDSSGDAAPGTFGIDLPAPTILADRAALYDTSAGDATVTDAGMLHETMPPGLPAAGVGSMTKVMVLLLALEAVDAGHVSLDDLVTVPATESAQWVVEGDQVSLRTLLHGMMKRSSNGSAIAIGLHLAKEAHGVQDIYEMSLDDAKDVVGEFMTARSQQLDLDDTIYCEPQGAGMSTPRDQMDLWLYASQHPQFWVFAGVGSYENFDPAFDADGDPKWIAPVTKGAWDRVDVDGHKDGVLKTNKMGYTEQGGQPVLDCDPEEPAVDSACIYCRIIQATRLGRTMLVQTSGSDTKGDSVDTLLGLLDWGVAHTFTPDSTGSMQDADAVVDFGLTHAGDTLAVTATVRQDDGSLEVCTRSMAVWVSDAIHTLDCERVTIAGLAPDDDPLTTNGTEIERVSTLEADGDYLTGHLVDGHLRLTTWRVGRRP